MSDHPPRRTSRVCMTCKNNISSLLSMGLSPSKEYQEGKKYDNRTADRESKTKESTKEQVGENLTGSHEPIRQTPKMETISTSSVTPRTKGRSFGVPAREVDSRQTSEGRDDDSRRSRFSDEQVHVNLAMADLMAYLQVVANNSNNLPMTRRDDPELKRMVSNLTSEEYARKSAAFIPADVRVIGGSFTKYGRVWDLPTSDEYNAQDGAQEPGRSYGGACCNAMLKVLYDAVNEAGEENEDTNASQGLFDDDDDDDATLSGLNFNRNNSFASLDRTNQSNPSTLTWATMMAKMKAEIKDIEYAQVPVLTSTRKIDLNQPFSLVPESFDPSTSKRRSLLVGCNYTHLHGAQLKASHDDVRSMKDYIVNVHGFPDSEGMMTVLLDDDHHKHPTFFNITEAFKSLSEQSQPGDAVFIHFAGHGGRILDSGADAENDSYDEVLAPSDYTTNGLIRDTLIFKTLLAPMRYGVTVTVLIDTCDTGMVLDMPYSWSPRSNSSAKMVQNDDFSFVRFLKVVKTLYESCTFTQLGRTVGSALISGNNLPRDISEEDDDDSQVGNSDAPKEAHLSSTEESQLAVIEAKVNGSGGGLLSCFCGSPTADEAPMVPSNTKKSKREQLSFEGRNPSLFEQVITCTLGQDVGAFEIDDASLESYLKANDTTSYSDRDGGDTTDESFEDEDSHFKHGRRRRHQRRSTRRHK